MTDSPVSVADVTLSPALLGEGRLQVRLDNPGNLAQVDLVAHVGTAAAGRPVPCLLGTGQATVEVPLELAQTGDNVVTLDVIPRSAWTGAPTITAGRRASALDLEAVAQQVRPVQAKPVSLQFHRWLPAPLEVTDAPREIMAGQTSLDIHGTLALSRRLQRGVCLRATLYRGAQKLSDAALERPEGDEVWLNVGTADLQPGSYRLRIELEGLPGALKPLESTFAVVPGAW
jgi:hypothetical protein